MNKKTLMAILLMFVAVAPFGATYADTITGKAVVVSASDGDSDGC